CVSSCLVLSSLPPSPGSALFPYTTLFRSERITAAYQDVQGWQSYQVQVDETSDYAMTAQGQQVATWQRRERDLALSGAYDIADRDRKSTRLNSSHVKISYAVFCLKKKSNK